ncbi:hypothetical protein BGZ63DRAFT_40100 [Mariannaea sp. PMI_226]|nr:hypothetical protein BGZ63DRAFT_40100 [Mariannaea sp. PMI_226]
MTVPGFARLRFPPIPQFACRKKKWLPLSPSPRAADSFDRVHISRRTVTEERRIARGPREGQGTKIKGGEVKEKRQRGWHLARSPALRFLAFFLACPFPFDPSLAFVVSRIHHLPCLVLVFPTPGHQASITGVFFFLFLSLYVSFSVDFFGMISYFLSLTSLHSCFHLLF